MYKIENYYNRFDESKNYEKLLARDGYPIQGAETNDMQEGFLYRLRGIGDALFKDGDIIRDATVIVDPESGAVRASSGAVYIRGAVRGVPEKTFSIPVEGTVVLGIWLKEHVISELEDASLRNPAIGSRGEGEPGAWRLQVSPEWGHDKETLFSGGAEAGKAEFYPVYAVDDGILRPKEAPPTLDAFTQSLAKYDRDSTAGGSYVVSGLNLLALDSTDDSKSQGDYIVNAGRARVNGYGVELATDRRLHYTPEPDLRTIDTEVHQATAEASDEVGQRLVIAHAPLFDIQAVRLTRRKKVSQIHGAYLGAVDDLPDTSIVSLVEVKQGSTVYAQGTDYRKSGDRIDWSPTGAEPASGSTYEVTYDFITSAEAENPDADGFTIRGAVEGTSIMLTYRQAIPRYDRLCLTQEGLFQWISGVASEQNPRPPSVPAELLPLATVYQSWRKSVAIENDAVRVVPFSEITAINERIDYALMEIARQRLEADVSTREAGARVGIFVDPLWDDSMRDQGLSQSAAIVDGELVLPISGMAAPMDADVLTPTALPFKPTILLAQELATGSMKVNPYMAFDPMPGQCRLTPAVDFWTESQSKWTSPVTRAFSTGSGNRSSTSTTTNTQLVGSSTEKLPNLRPIEVRFEVTGFGPKENLVQILFDGIPVNPL